LSKARFYLPAHSQGNLFWKSLRKIFALGFLVLLPGAIQIDIHGHGSSSDWTWGCVALENEDIRELFDAVNVGTPVTIQP